ncbi:hypothetical protein Clacol_002222 [Clathrus columnatus]|uniref:TPR-like protein n=1 Tax=Clathrus columnatus TaxID=1419009 RepID=A0AAV5A4S6_9AGAM|nr:hypothetical protein Clacol_002222 [Clathrus columnatus]
MRLVHSLPYTIFSLLTLFARADPSASNGSVDPPGLQPLIAKANALLSSGQFTDAARAYTEAIDLSPASYLLYFKRATAQLSLNRHDSALADFDKVLELTGGNFDKAYFSKGKIFAKEGKWAEAKKMLKSYTRKNIADRAAGDLLFSISQAEVATKKAQQAQKSKQWEVCRDDASTALQTATHSTVLRSLRANCALQTGDIDQVVADLTRLTHLTAPSTSALLTISSISYYLLPTSPQALAILKQCLHYDPDSNLCAPAHRQLKKFDKVLTQINNAVEALNWSEVIKLVTDFAPKFDAAMEKALKPESLNLEGGLPVGIVPKQKSVKRRELYQAICQAYFKTNLLKQSENWCKEVLEMEGGENDLEALKALGEGNLLKEDWETAVRYLERAFEASGRSNSDIHQRLQKAHRLLKQSKKKDYYKVLGVPRDADARTIKKA